MKPIFVWSLLFSFSIFANQNVDEFLDNYNQLIAGHTEKIEKVFSTSYIENNGGVELLRKRFSSPNQMGKVIKKMVKEVDKNIYLQVAFQGPEGEFVSPKLFVLEKGKKGFLLKETTSKQ